ncbi:MAG: hypothetical protein ABTQ93_14860 [Candidatus Competibacter denitrificans]
MTTPLAVPGIPEDRPSPRIEGFKGLDNRNPPSALGLAWQQDAVNVVCDNTGWLRKRPGLSLLRTAVMDVHATSGGRWYFVDSQSHLCDGRDATVLADAFVGAPFSWFELGNATFALSPTAAWAIYPDRVVPWGVPDAPPPVVEGFDATPRDALTPGRRLVACVHCAADGRLGGTQTTVQLDLPSGKGLMVTASLLPGYRTRVYASAADGTVLYYRGELVPSQTHALLVVGDDLAPAMPLETLGLSPTPRAALAAAWRSRAVVADYESAYDRSVLYFSRPGNPHLFDLGQDVQLIEGRVTALHEHSDGLLVATDREVLVITPDFGRRVLFGTGAPQGLIQTEPDGSPWLWTQVGPYRPATNATPCLAQFIPPPDTQVAVALVPFQGTLYLIAHLSGRPAAVHPLDTHPTRPIRSTFTNGVTL